jgi:hypothetical protein
MDRCGLADFVCAGSGWVGIRPRAVEDFPRGKCYPRIAFRSNLARKAIHFRARTSCDSCAAAKHAYQSSFSPN